MRFFDSLFARLALILTLFVAVPLYAADHSITAANVLMSGSGSPAEGIAGATITAGQPLYKDTTDSNKLKLADANDSTKINVVGLALHGASAGQPIKYCTLDASFTPGFTIAAGTPVFLSATAGALCPLADITGSGNYGVFIGVGIGSNKINFRPVVGGVVP